MFEESAVKKSKKEVEFEIYDCISELKEVREKISILSKRKIDLESFLSEYRNKQGNPESLTFENRVVLKYTTLSQERFDQTRFKNENKDIYDKYKTKITYERLTFSL